MNRGGTDTINDYPMPDAFLSETCPRPNRIGLRSRHPLHEAVIVALFQFADHQGICQPSIRELSDATKYSKRSVVRAIQDLVACEVLMVEHRQAADGASLRNIYKLTTTRATA